MNRIDHATEILGQQDITENRYAVVVKEIHQLGRLVDRVDDDDGFGSEKASRTSVARESSSWRVSSCRRESKVAHWNQTSLVSSVWKRVKGSSLGSASGW